MEINDMLKRYVTIAKPFGPEDVTAITDPASFAALYDWNNKAFAEALRGSDVLVGRRGSGKSSLLRSFPAREFLLKQFGDESGRVFRDRYSISTKTLNKIPDIVVEVDTPIQVDELEGYCRRRPQIPSVEILAEMWRRRIWWLIGKELKKIEKEKWWDLVPVQIKGFIQNDDVETIVNGVQKSKSDLNSDEYIAQLEDFLGRNCLRVIVTFDNLEFYGFEPTQNAVLGGLIAATGNFIGVQHPCLSVRLCLPAELFRDLQRVSFRPDKDLHRVQYLHWNAAELLQLAARHLLVYLSIWNPDEFDIVRGRLMVDRATLMEFWHRYLPVTIENSVGVRESTVTYILRHTQMLPRQLVFILNKICNRFAGEGDELFGRRFTEYEIRKGVEDTEEVNAEAVLHMFQGLYPVIHDIFDAVLPRLPREFTYGDLQSVWHSSAKTYMVQVNKPDFISFWQLMLATGAIGLKVEEESTETYSTARFEYNSKYNLSISDKDTLCVHPMFSRIYNLVKRDGAKLILPRGSDFRTDLGRA